MTANTIINRNTAAAQKPSPPRQVIAQLSPKWRVIESPPGWFGQWLLQRRQGAPGRRSTGWTNQSFCVSRRALKRCVGEYCGDVDPAAQAALDALPEKHPPPQRTTTKEPPQRGLRRFGIRLCLDETTTPKKEQLNAE